MSKRTLAQLLVVAFSLVVFAIALSESASADLDTFTTGDGHEGAVTVSTNSVLNYSAPLNAAASAGATSLTTGAGQAGATGTAATTGSPAQTQFEANRLALVIQSANFTGSAPSGNQTDIDLSSNSVGRWELARISSITGTLAAGMTVNFSAPLINSYTSTGAQIVAVPEFTTVQINNTRSWSANPWNGTNGGITAFLATGAVNLNNAASSINANGDGFRGGLLYNGTATGCTQLDGTVGGGKGEGIVSGVYPGTATSYASRGNIANGGGGGVCENSGGGGGGNGGQGGIGGQSYDGSRNVGGLGGSKLNYSAFDHAIFGGGGGAGDENNSNGGAGGNGGGFVFVRANSLTGSGTISATGNAGSDSVATGSSDAAGGGGAGGVVYARFNTTAACGSVSVQGGAGGNEQSTAGVHGPGGGGAGGRLVLQSSGGTCPTSVANGVGGTVPNGGGGTRGSGPTSSTDATSSGATESVTGGGGIATPTAAVSTPADGVITNNTTPTITGTSSMNAGTIRVTVDGVYVGSATTAADGTWSYTLPSALAAGAHTYTVRPVYYGLAGSSTASRTINIDLTPPAAPTVSSNRTGTVQQTTATITYTAAEGGGTMQCSLDGGAYATCSASPVALSALADGNHSYAVRQVDVAGNVGSASTVAWVVDTTAPPAPTVTRTAPASTPTSSTTAQITFSANEAGGTLQCSVDGGAYATCAASPASLSGLTNGAHSYAVRQVDAVGNVGTATTVNWTVDTVAPAAPTVSSNRTGTVAQTTASITYTPAEGGGTMQCSLDGGAYATCAASPVAISGLGDGNHSYAVRQIDAAGNTGSATTVAWVVDTTAPPAPTVTRTAPASTPTSSTSAQITFSANEAGGTLQCSVDGGAYATCTASPANLSGLTDGAHSYSVRQQDVAGNTGTATTVNWTVDTAAPPAPTVSSNRSGTTNTNTAQITFSANEAGGTLQCSQDGGAYATCAASPVNLASLADGNHSYAVRQVDAAGNTGSATTVAWVVDTVAPPAPTVTRASPTSSPTTSTSAQISFSANEAGGSLECSVDGGAYAACAASPANLSGLADGAHSYAVRQVDAGGNISAVTTVSWTVDTTAPPAPTVTRTTPASTPTSSTSAQITFSANEAGGTLQCSVDGGAYATCAASPANLSGLTNGAHSYAVRQQDAAGNTSASTTVNWVVDTVAPAAPTVSSNRTGSVNVNTATITYTAAEGGGTMQCSLDGGAYATCAASPVALSSLADGAHTYAVRQVDAAGNNGSATTVGWTVDTVAPPAPTVTRTSPSSTPTSQTTAQITFSANEAGGTLQCSVDGGAYATCGASPANLSGLTDGAHSYSVRQVDAATNTSSVTTVNWTVDTVGPVAPTVTRTSPASSPTSQTTAQITFNANEAGGTLQCSVDGGAYATCGTSPANLSALTDGTHSYAVRQLDAAGNVGSVASVSWVVDTTGPVAPTVTRTSPASSPTAQTTAQITYSANEAGGTLQCSVDGGAYATCGASPANLSALADGNHSYAVRQVDGVGNVGSVASVAWVVDTAAPPAPTVTRTAPAATPTSSTSAQITFSANEAGGTLQCSVDGGAYATCGSSPANLSSLTNGAHSYAVRQQDAAGNTSAVTTVNWTVDTVAPAAPTVSSNRTGTVSATTATITYTAAEGGGTMQCSVDGGAYATCAASPVALSGLGDGAHSYAVRQIDAAGNTGAATTVSWTVDTVAPPGPTVTRVAPSTTPTNSTTAQISFSANEAGGTLECSVDGGAYATCGSSPANLSGLTDGAHSYSVRQVDAGGNTGTPTTVNWTVDTSPPPAPTVTRTSPTSTPTTQTSAQIAFSANEAGGTLQCSVDGGAYATCAASPANLSGLADGNHSYAVRQVDAAGNTGSVSSVAWVVDTTAPPAPTVTRTSPASTPTSQTTAQITFSANEAGGTLQCSVDGGAFATCGSSPANLSSLTNGAHSYAVRQQDAAGNTSAVTTVNWVVDTIAPAAPTVSSNRTGTVNVTTATITYTAAEGGGTMQCSLDGGAFAACTASPISLSALADGNHSYAVRQTDAAGNVGSSSTVAWVVDTVVPPAPTVTRTSPTSTPTSQTTAQITFSANEAGGTLQCSVDGGAYAACGASPANLSALADGAHSYAVRQVDAGSNIGTSTTVNWVVDTIAPPAPTVTRTSPVATPTSQTTAQITYAANEAGGTLQCSVDGGAYAACGSSPANLSGLTDGAHSYAVRQVDAAGNTGAATTVNWTVDTAPPPAPTVNSNRTGTTNLTTAQITFSANEAGGTLQCSADGGAYATCAASPVSLSALADGNHSYAVRQVDAAGNTGSATTVAWTVDTVVPPAPTVTRTSPASTPTSQTTAQITFSANEAGGTLQCSVDGGAFATCGASPANLSGLTDGAHSYAVRQVDAGSNTGATTTVNWVVDTVAPAAPTVNSNRSGTVNVNTASITYTAAEAGGTVQCSLDGGAYATCAASPVALTALADGNHTYSVRQLDAAGNTGSATSVAWTVDTVAPPAPTVTRTSPSSTPTSQTTAQITFSANEAGGTLQCSVDGGSYATCGSSPANLSGLTDGAHSYSVRQVDAGTNVGAATTVNWTVDTAAPPAPTVTRTSPTSTPTSQTTAQITFSANEAGGTLQCSVDGGAFATCGASPVNLSGLTNGAHSYAVRQVDAAGNTGAATTVNWTVDTVAPPAPTVASNRTGTVNVTTAQITFSANEAGGTLQCSVDGGSYATCAASPVNLSSLADGAHSYAVRQIDAAGNTGSTTTVAWTVDTIAPPAPTVTRTSPASTPTALTTAQIAFSANEAGGTLQCSVDGGSYSTCGASPANLSGLSDGAHSYAVRQVDAGSNTGPATTVNWVVDTAAPAAPSVSSNRTGTVNATTATITYTAAEGGGTMQCSLDGGTYATCAASPIALSSLADGSHSYAVRQIDAAGNTGSATTVAWTVDTIAPPAPTVTRSSPASTPTALTTAQIAFSANEAGGTLQCAVDGGAYASCGASPANLAGLTDGPHSYSVRQVDAGTNVGAATTVNWFVDTIAPPAPTVTRTSPASTPTNQTTAQIDFSANEAGGSLECSLDGAAYVACGASPANLSGLSDGAHSYAVRQVDVSGNNGAATTVSWTVDTGVPPAPSVSSNRSGTTNETTAHITYSAGEAGGTLECSIDGGAFATCGNSPDNLSSLTDGPHSYSVRQVDAAGNTGSTTTVAWTVDTVDPPAPTVVRTSPASSPASQTTAQITFSANEAGGALQCSVDGGAYSACGASPANLSSLTDGAHSYSVRQVDSGGNIGAASTVNWVVDTTSPAAPSVTSNRTGSVNETTATITYAASESGGTLECSLDGATYATCDPSPIELSSLTDGNHTYASRQVDAAGNTGSATTVAWTVDTVAPPAPTVTRTAPTSSPTSQTTAEIDFSANEAGGTLECSVDGGAYSPCSASPANLSGLTDGAHSYSVRQVDDATNVGSYTTVNWTVDTAAPPAPTVTRTAPTASPTNQTTAQIDFSANEAGGTLECSVDGGAFTACGASPASPSDLTDGAHSYAVRQVDAAGNTGTEETVNWTVDTVAPPAPTVAADRSGTTSETTAEVTFSANEAGGTLECSIDGGAFVTCASSPDNLSGLADGPHSYAVRQVDEAGNTGSTTTVSWIVDTDAPAAPTVTRTAPTSSPTSDTTAEIAFTASEPGGTLECSVDGGAYAPCPSSPATLSGLADGPHSYAVRQVDAGDNIGASASVSWTVDTVAPIAPSVSSNRTGTVSESTAEITYTASEVGGTLECSLDGAAFTTCAASPISLTGLTDGPHTYSVRQLDDAGNADSASTVAWIVDLTAPDAPAITSPTGSPYYSAIATPAFSGTAEPNSTVKLYDGATLVATATADGSGDWSVATVSLTDGPHAITAVATDSAGNSGNASAPTNVTVDTTAPTVAISDPADGGFINTGVATLTFSVTDANPSASSLCQIDGGAFTPCTSGFTTPALSSGQHTITVQHSDLAGNTGSSSTTFTVDSATPLVSVSSPAAFEHVPTANVEITFSVSDDNPAASSDCSVDGAVAVPCTSVFTTSALADGDHTVTVSNTDSAGNTGSATVTFTVDTQAPSAPTITDAPSDPVASDAAEFSFNGAETGGAFECSLDGASFTTCTSPASYLGLADGGHEFRVRQVDEAGNAGAVATHNWTVDTTPPAAPTLNGPNAHTNNPESTVSFAGSPDSVELRCSFNGGPFSACPTSPLTLGQLPDGNYTFTVEAFDAAGNSSSSTIGWEVDTAAPGAPTITAGPVGSVPSPDAQFSFTGAESGGLFRCSLGVQPAVTCTSPFDITGLADGTYTFRVRQVDAAGNVGPMASRTWTVDTTPPPTPTVTGPSSPSGQTSALIDFSSTESGVSFQCSVDGGPYSACTDPLSLSGLSDGSHTVAVRAYDAAGNGSAVGSFSWTVDHTLYTADISGAPSGVVNTTSASLTLSASLPGSTFQCSIDGAAFSSCSSPVSISGLTEGSHTFRLRASKGAQNAPEVTRSWTVDLTNPSVTITAPLAASTTGADAAIAFSTSDLHAPITTTCKLDSAAPAPCTSPQSYSNLSEGNHTVIVSATDAAGNSGSAAVTWHVDHTAPSAPQITTPAANGATNDTTPTIGGTAEASSTVKLYDGATLLATVTAGPDGAWSWTPSSPLAEATYNFRATATDAYDNTSALSAIRTLTVDTTAPAAPSISAPAAGPTNDSTPLVSGAAEPGAKVTVYVDGNPVSGTVTVAGDGSWQKTIAPALSDGPHTITAVATDDAGNISDPATDRAITVDTAAPSVSITSPAAAAKLNSDSINVTFTAEAGATTRCKLDTDAYASCTSPFAVSGLSEGSHTVTVEATDSAGNAATAVVTFSVDLTDPTVQLTGGPNAGSESNDDTPTFTFTSNEPGTFECSIDGGAFSICSSPFTLPALGDGPHTFTVHSVDEAGNESADVTRSWTVDTTAPGAPAIDTPNDNSVTPDSTPTVTGNAGSAEAGATLTVHINGTASGTTTVAPDGSWSFTVASSLTDNIYAFTAKATDAAGNVSTASNTVRVRVDGSNPTAQITAKPGALSNDSTPTFAFSSDEPGTFECKIDSGAYAACSSPFTSVVLADGAHHFFVRAIDASGNTSAEKEWDWTIDTTAPNVTVTSNTPAAGVSPTFSFSSDESGTTYRCRIDGSGVFATCSSPFNAPTLPTGSHTLEVQYTDAAGNSGTKSVNFTVTAPPTTQPPVTTPPPTTPNPPAAQTCPGSGDEPGIPANMTVISAVAKKNTVKFTTSSDKYILVRVSIYNGKKLVGTAVRANNPGKRIVAIKTKKALPKNKKFTVRLSAITMSGGKSVAGTNMVTDKKGKTTLVGADGKVGAPPTSTVDCAPEKGSKKIKVKVATKISVKISDKKFAATAKASDWAVATFRVVQNGKTVARKVVLLKPGKKVRASLKALAGNKLVKGKAMIQVATCTVDGQWQLFKKPFKVK